MINLLIQQITDPIQRENFVKIQEEINEGQVILKGRWRFLTLTFTGAVTNFRYPHLMGFVPKDIIQTSLTGAGALTWNYELFSTTHLDITTTGACVVRALVGLIPEGRR